FWRPSRGATSQTTTFTRTPPAAASSWKRRRTHAQVRTNVLKSAPTSVASQHTFLFELVEVGVGEAEQADVHVAVVAALFPRRRPAHLARRVGELRDDPGADVLAELGVDMLDQHLARLELRVFEDVGDRVDRATDHARFVHDAVDLGGRPRRRPLGDDPLDLLLVLAARDVGGEARVVGELRLPDRGAEAGEAVVRGRRDQDALAV